MRILLGALVVVGLFVAGSASAAVVTGRISIVNGAPFGEHAIRVDYSGDLSFYNDLFLTTVDSDTFAVADFTIGAPFSVFLVSESASFTPAYVAGNPVLASNIASTGIGNQFDVLVGESIFLGFYMDALLPSGPTVGDEFAWIEITNTGTGLSSLGSATALATGGIIVGTTTSIPEPKVVFSLLGGFAFFRRRR